MSWSRLNRLCRLITFSANSWFHSHSLQIYKATWSWSKQWTDCCYMKQKRSQGFRLWTQFPVDLCETVIDHIFEDSWHKSYIAWGVSKSPITSKNKPNFTVSYWDITSSENSPYPWTLHVCRMFKIPTWRMCLNFDNISQRGSSPTHLVYGCKEHKAGMAHMPMLILPTSSPGWTLNTCNRIQCRVNELPWNLQ
jgi:hypothetical protein